MLRSSFWSGPELKTNCAKIGWSSVCAPKVKGGCGLRVLKDWKKVAMSRLLWAIEKKAVTLWIKWVHAYIIKDQCMWSMTVPALASRTIRKIFGLRNLVQPWIKFNSTLVMVKAPFHGLIIGITRVLLKHMDSNLLRTLHSKVASVIRNGSWIWARRSNSIVREILESSPNTLIPKRAQEDSVIWSLTANRAYSIKSAWQAIMQHFPKVLWCKII